MHWLKRWSTPVVLCDRDLPDGSWKDLLGATKTLSRPPRVVVTSRLAEERLWAEALNLGCHDVLHQPFQASELFRVLNLAWRNWHDGAEDFGDCAQALPAVVAT
jgi:DNA-binding response OmpR family regulator